MSGEQDKHDKTMEGHSNVLRMIWRPDPQRPIYSALLEAELQRIDKLFDGSLEEKMRAVKNEQEFQLLLKELLTLSKEGAEILEWIFPQEQITFNAAFAIAESMKKANLSIEMIESFIEKAGRKPRGRPITKRQIGIKALEKQILEPERKWSYAELAQQFCNCDKARHDQQCAQSLRQVMIKLRKLVASYAPHPPL